MRQVPFSFHHGAVQACSGAMLRVLQAAFVASFKTNFTFGALVAFLVTVADISIANIGAAFWGLVIGVAVSWLFERADFDGLTRRAASKNPSV